MNCERGEVLEYEIFEYDSAEGTCTGNLIKTYSQLLTELGDSRICDGFNELEFNAPSFEGDFAFRSFEYDKVDGCDLTFLNQSGFNDEFVPYGVGTNGGLLRYSGGGTNYSCPVDCDGTRYALNLVRELQLVPGFSLGYANPSLYDKYDFTIEQLYTNWTECDNPISSCTEWSNPQNASLTYGCDCPPSQFDFGVQCTGQDCLRTCGGVSEDTENFYFNYSNTQQAILESGTPTESLTYFGQQAKDFIAVSSPGLSSIIWLITFALIIGIFFTIMAKAIKG